jgi:FkbM family methyltransferase
MFLDEEYRVEGLSPSIIVDVGSNIGASVAFFKSWYPEARIVGIEPDPVTFERLRDSVGGLPGVELHPWAVADTTGPRAFDRSSQSWGSSLADSNVATTMTVDTVTVQALTVTDLLDRLGIESADLLKLDVEGGEWLIFDEPSGLEACKVIVGELHLDEPDQTVERALAALERFDVEVTPARRADRVHFVARRR